MARIPTLFIILCAKHKPRRTVATQSELTAVRCSSVLRGVNLPGADRIMSQVSVVSVNLCDLLSSHASTISASLAPCVDRQAKVLVVSAGCAAGALYGFYLVDGLERARKEALRTSAPPVAVPNLPEHLQPALEGRSAAPDRGSPAAEPPP